MDDAVMCTLYFDTDFTADSYTNLILLCILFLIFSIGDRYSHHISNLLIQSCSWINKYIYTLWQHTNTYTQFRKKYRYKHTYK